MFKKYNSREQQLMIKQGGQFVLGVKINSQLLLFL